MDRDTSWVRPILIIFLLALPPVVMRIASEFTDNPYLQPLGLTVESLASQSDVSGAGPFVDVQVAWGRAYDGGRSRDGLRKMLDQALRAQTGRYRVAISEVDGDRIRVTFVVGPNRYGPVPPGGSAEALNLALTAVRMAQSGSN